MRQPLVTIILAGGKGTRMGTSDKHKVCFEVLGVPVIIRALETYNLCGSAVNVVVVGAMAESVMATVNQRFPGTPYAFQQTPRGTGDAARKGAEILERMRFDGDVLVVAGDKVIDPRVIRQLRAAHEQSGADVTLATAKRPPNSSAGILLKSARGNIAGILEEAERRRLAALGSIHDAFRRQAALTREALDRLVTQACGEKTARALAAEIWGLKLEGESPQSQVRSRRSEKGAALSGVLRREEFERRFSKDEQWGFVGLGRKQSRRRKPCNDSTR